jgi:hypothetical protein
MTTLKDRGAVAVWDLAALADLSDERSKVLLVSARTLHLLSRLDKTDTPRYYRYAKEYLDGQFYRPVEEWDQDEADLVDEIANAFGVEIVPVNNIRPIITADLYRTADKTVTHNTTTDLDFDASAYDPDGLTDLDAGTITVPRDGVYLITCSVRWAANSTGRRQINVTTGDIQMLDNRNATLVGATFCRISQAIYLPEGTTLSVTIYQSSGGDLACDSLYPTNPFAVHLAIVGY